MSLLRSMSVLSQHLFDTDILSSKKLHHFHNEIQTGGNKFMNTSQKGLNSSKEDGKKKKIPLSLPFRHPLDYKNTTAVHPSI